MVPETQQSDSDEFLRRPETAFPEMALWLRGLVSSATVDEQSLQVRMHVCQLSDCAGACCANGAFLELDEGPVIEQLVDGNLELMQSLGVSVDEALIANVSRGSGRPPSARTATKSVDGGPASRMCTFWMTDGRCALQVVGTTDGRHPWYYKPVACWLHPLDVRTCDGQVTVGLFKGDVPPVGAPPSVGNAPCSMPDQVGVPAVTLLLNELAFLRGIAGGPMQ